MSTPTAVNNGIKPVAKSDPGPLSMALGRQWNVDPRQVIGLLRSTIIKPDRNGKQATDAEVAAFMLVANEYRLNPFTKQIHAFVGKGGALVPIVGIDGWAAIVNRRDDFDGCEFSTTVAENGKPVACTCVMHVKGRAHPVQVTEWYSECYRPTEPWNGMPHRMLRHKAYMQAARIAFGLAGIHDEDEGADIAQRQASQGRSAEVSFPREARMTRTQQIADKLAAPAGGDVIDADFQVDPPTESLLTEPAESDIEKDAIADDLAEQIKNADTMFAAQGVGAELVKHQAFIGENRYNRLAALLRKRNRELENQPKK